MYDMKVGKPVKNRTKGRQQKCLISYRRMKWKRKQQTRLHDRYYRNKISRIIKKQLRHK